jgi:molecular chaperone DnaK (HSP70)
MKIYPTLNTEKVISDNDYCYGIDLGTTYSLLAKVDFKDVDFESSNKIPVNFVKIKQESPFPYDTSIEDEKVASIVSMVGNKIYVGNNLYHLKGHPDFNYRENIFYQWKVEMGVDVTPMYPDAIDQRLNMPYKVASLIMKYMQAMHLQSKDKTLKNTVITVPASFQVNQRRDTIKAAKDAGIELSNRMLIDEPNAAFLGYFNRLSETSKQSWAKDVTNKNILVLDFGGGTLDLSILNVSFNKKTGICIGNKAISRYNDLGGNDLDLLIAEQFLFPKLQESNTIFKNITLHNIQTKILPQLTVIAEKIKKGICEKLSLKAVDEDVRTLELSNIKYQLSNCDVSYDDATYCLYDVEIDGEEFGSIFSHIFTGKKYSFGLCDKSLTPINQSITDVIEKSDLTLDDIRYVLYVGGSSFNPFLKSYVCEKLINAEALLTNEPDKLVAEGAAIYSYFYHARGVSLINPITSDSIGIRIKGDEFHPIIEKNQLLPVDVQLPNFKIQSEQQRSIVVPVCINGIDFPIGEIRCELKKSFPINAKVQIKASISQDKLFDIAIYIDDEFVDSAQIDNPYSIGMVGQEQLDISELKLKINKSKQEGNKNKERQSLRQLIWKHSAVDNYIGMVETAEEYIRRFDDQDSSVWNMIYCGNSGLGRDTMARNGLKKAIEISPDEPSYIYNFSLILERESSIKALEFLDKQVEDVKSDTTVMLKIFLLKYDVNKVSSTLIEHSKTEAKNIVGEYKSTPYIFSSFDKQCLLPKVFKIAGEAFSYVTPSSTKHIEDENSYLHVKAEEMEE